MNVGGMGWLPPRNWRVGLSAYDVYMAACSPDIVITRSEKDGIPTIGEPLASTV